MIQSLFSYPMIFFRKMFGWIVSQRELCAGILSLSTGFLFFGTSLAASAPISTGIPPLTNAAAATTLLCNIMDDMVWLLMIISVIMIIWAAFLYVTANGDEKKVSEAKMCILYAAIGIIVALIAKGFPGVIASIFPKASVSLCPS